MMAFASCDNAPMSKDDELDRRRAAAFAWRFVRPGEETDLPEETHAEEPENTRPRPRPAARTKLSGKAAAGREDAAGASPTGDERARRDDCVGLTAAIERVRRMAEGGQTEPLAALLGRAGELARELCAVDGYPWQGARLRRLARGCRYLLDEDEEEAWTSSRWLYYTDPALLELQVEVARTGALAALAGLMLAITDGRPAVGHVPGAIARVARMLDDGPSQIARCIAIDASTNPGRSAAVRALRRALRAPHFTLRCRALDELEQHFPDQLQAADVVFLLEDAVIHAPPDFGRSLRRTQERASVYFPRMLEGAIVRLRPGGALDPLVRLAEGRCAPQWSLYPIFGEGWALDVLAKVFPEAAAPLIDRWFRYVSWQRRELATTAAGHLPDELARPRLLLAAGDPVPEVAARAHAIWRERYAEPCPFDPMSGIEAALLAGPPSEQMRSRLAVLRSAPLEARAELAEALLGEAPDPEALVLLLFAAGDSRIWERRLRPGLPAYRQTFCRALIERFGARAVEGLLALAARYPDGGSGWLHTLAELVMDRHMPESTHPILRTGVARRCASPDERLEFDTLEILARLGVPSEQPEAIDRLWRMARDPAASGYQRQAAARAFARSAAEIGHLDTAVQAEMEAALAVPDLPRFSRAAVVGLGRALPGATALTERVLDELGPARPEDARVIAALADCVEALAAAGQLSDTFLGKALRQPGTYLCAAAARYARRHKFLGPDADTLAALLAGDDPACAAEAACALLGHGLIDATHPGLFAIATRVPAVLRAEMVSFLRLRGASWSSLWPLMEPLLISGDPDVTAELLALSHELDREGLPEKLRPLLPQILDRELRRDIVDIFAREGTWYWRDFAEE
jgi:hypothetical protein